MALSSGIAGPSPSEVGALWFELTSAFAVGAMAQTYVGSPQRVANGLALQRESAELLAQVATRLGILIIEADPETGGALSRGAQVAWRWLSRSSKAVVTKAAAAAKGLGGATAAIAVLGGVGVAGVTVYDWVTGEEQTRREALSARKEVELALVARMPPEQVAGALDAISSGLDGFASGGLTWWQWGLIGGGLFGAYKLATSSNSSSDPKRRGY